MNLSTTQEKIIKNSTGKTVVSAAAGSGKTTLLTEKVRQLLRDGVEPSKIAVITFTNMAANEMRMRLGEDYKDKLYVGTIHGLANYMLVSHGISTKKVLDREEFDKLFTMVGENPQCIIHYDWILMDEAQDTNLHEFKFVLDYIDPPHFLLVGDLKQSIYGFKGARPDLLLELMNSQGISTFVMNENYRNCSAILAHAKRIIRPTGLEDTSISRRIGKVGVVNEVDFSYERIMNSIMLYDEYKDWAILVRTNSLVDSISSYLMRHQIPCETFKQGDLNNEQLKNIMGKNTVKVLTVHSAKGLEWNNVIVYGLRFKPNEERNVCYVAATRARNRLIWMKGRMR